MRSARGHVKWRTIKIFAATTAIAAAIGYVVLMGYKLQNTDSPSSVSETVHQAIAAVRSWKDDYRESPEFKQKVENILEYDHQNHIQSEAEQAIEQIEADKAARLKALEDEANAKIEIERTKIREAIEKKRELEKVTESVRMKAIGRIRSYLDRYGKAQFAEAVYDPTLPRELVEICTCESGFTHYEADGTVRTGRKDPDDRGICQLNRRFSGPKAYALGFDIENKEDNQRTAKALFYTEGTAPWNPSKSCWSKAVASL